MNPSVPPSAPPAQPPLLSYHGPMGEQSSAVWRDGYLLVATKNAYFPPRCIKCNAPSESYLRFRPTWHPPLLYLIILLNLIIYAIVALCVQKRGTIYVGLCRRHRTRRLVCILVGWGLVFLAIGVGYAAISLENGALGVMIPLLVLAGLITGFTGSRVIAIDHIDDRYVYLKNVQSDYLLQLPGVPPPPAVLDQIVVQQLQRR